MVMQIWPLILRSGAHAHAVEAANQACRNLHNERHEPLAAVRETPVRRDGRPGLQLSFFAIFLKALPLWAAICSVLSLLISY